MKVGELCELMILLDSTDISDDAEIVLPGGDHSYLPVSKISVEVAESWGNRCLTESLSNGTKSQSELDLESHQRGIALVKVLAVR